MDLYTINYIKNNELVYRYLRDNSSWYKYLNRNSSVLKEVEEQARKHYEVRTEDKIKKLSSRIDMISSFLDLLK